MALSLDSQRRMLAELHRLSAERETAERQMRAEFDTASGRVQRELSDARQSAIMRFQMDRDSTQREYDAAVVAANSIYETRHEIVAKEQQQAATQAQNDAAKAQRRAKRALSEESWEANTVYEATHNAPKLQLEQETRDLAAAHDVLREVVERANRHLALCRLKKVQHLPLENTVAATPSEHPAAKLNELAKSAIAGLESLKQLRWPNWLIGGRPAGMALVIWLAACGVSYWLFRNHLWVWPTVGTVVAAIAITAGGLWLFKQARAAVSAPYEDLHVKLQEGEELHRAAVVQAKERCALESQRIVAHRDQELQTAQQKFDGQTAEIMRVREAALLTAKQKYAQAHAELVGSRDAALAEAHANYPAKLQTIQQRYQQELRAAQEQSEKAGEQVRRRHDDVWNALAEKWRAGTAAIRASIEVNLQNSRKFFPAWSDAQWNTWRPSAAAPPSLQFGHIHVDLRSVPGGISQDNQFNGLLPVEFDLPALLPFPQNASLLVKAAGEGRRRAIELVQSVMLRMLTAIPPSKVRFTIIDPVGLGENFAGFMHLADHDEQLVTNRIWTDPGHIEARLADLTEQMENVIQKYLRNEFRSIDEYNAFAGEVAEPFRVLVVANFPVNFTDTAAKRLTSIATSGARCGVYTLIVNDVKLPLPPQFDLKDLERNAITLTWNGERFVWADADYEKYPLHTERPPNEEQFTRLVQTVGRGAKDAKRVEVPFEYVAPPREKWWTGDSAGGIRVPLGRAGATKLQYLQLGEGTAQHVLVAGKTGSGKSTLLHALVTNLALTYSPDQIELYLIDFKKGVEFKTYATHSLPHARVIAVESEREFGLSVIENLDAELRRRGDLFREAGAQDVAGYRAVAGANSLPRILLVVDEFQELFTDDDKLAQDAALLLDRLVRQGRAFGMHVLLGSQTLGGAYSLARSTIGQMAVRIALQCSEADAHLILSEENSAARLLSRPGEAIYNDANGLVHGNHPFQIVWLGDERREQYLLALQKMATEQAAAKTSAPPAAPIVFEGNVPADIKRNRALAELLRAGDWPVQSTPVHAWLGEAIAIKDPTAAVFRPQSGDNLLVVGHRAESAMGMFASAMLGLAAQHRPASSRTGGFAAGSAAMFYVLEHDRPADLPIDRPLADSRGGLAAFSTVLPHTIQSAGRRDLPAMLGDLAREVERRHGEEDRQAPAIYLFICDLGRFRDLRRDENDMGFSFGSDKPVGPATLLGNILRDGPAVGVYTLAWCDSLTAVQRCFDRQGLREFALRVLLQMSSNDSSHLIDVPLASKLGPHVALFHNEEEGRLEKFRPYAWPSLEWLRTVQEHFNLRVPAENI
jgi:DNA segregation ATPase FtsK/SpoIIIE, S-DNA-T family